MFPDAHIKVSPGCTKRKIFISEFKTLLLSPHTCNDIFQRIFFFFFYRIWRPTETPFVHHGAPTGTQLHRSSPWHSWSSAQIHTLFSVLVEIRHFFCLFFWEHVKCRPLCRATQCPVRTRASLQPSWVKVPLSPDQVSTARVNTVSCALSRIKVTGGGFFLNFKAPSASFHEKCLLETPRLQKREKTRRKCGRFWTILP